MDFGGTNLHTKWEFDADSKLMLAMCPNCIRRPRLRRVS